MIVKYETKNFVNKIILELREKRINSMKKKEKKRNWNKMITLKNEINKMTYCF